MQFRQGQGFGFEDLVDLRDQRMIKMLIVDFRKGHKILAATGVSHVVMQEPDIRRLIGCTPKQI